MRETNLIAGNIVEDIERVIERLQLPPAFHFAMSTDTVRVLERHPEVKKVNEMSSPWGAVLAFGFVQIAVDESVPLGQIVKRDGHPPSKDNASDAPPS